MLDEGEKRSSRNMLLLWMLRQNVKNSSKGPARPVLCY